MSNASAKVAHLEREVLRLRDQTTGLDKQLSEEREARRDLCEMLAELRQADSATNIQNSADLAQAMGIGESGDWLKLLDVIRLWRKQRDEHAADHQERMDAAKLSETVNKERESRQRLFDVLSGAHRPSSTDGADLVSAAAEVVSELRELRQVSSGLCDACDEKICERCEMCHECSDDRGECRRASAQGSPGGMSLVIESLTSAMMAASKRDWSDDPVDAWLYGVIVGWDLDGIEADVADRNNWNHQIQQRIRRLHAVVMAASGEPE